MIFLRKRDFPSCNKTSESQFIWLCFWKHTLKMADIGLFRQRLKTEDKGNWLKYKHFSSRMGNESVIGQAQEESPIPKICGQSCGEESLGRFSGNQGLRKAVLGAGSWSAKAVGESSESFRLNSGSSSTPKAYDKKEACYLL